MMKFKCFSLAAVIASAVTLGAAKADGLISIPTKALEWQDLANSDGIRFANVRGNLTGNGAYEAFVLFPGGRDNPLHTHSQALPTVVLQGTFYAVIDGKRTEYPAGSFYELPADKVHLSGCVAGMDCLLFQYQSRGFDLITTK